MEKETVKLTKLSKCVGCGASSVGSVSTITISDSISTGCSMFSDPIRVSMCHELVLEMHECRMQCLK